MLILPLHLCFGLSAAAAAATVVVVVVVVVVVEDQIHLIILTFQLQKKEPYIKMLHLQIS
jgi:hypothetical protein